MIRHVVLCILFVMMFSTLALGETPAPSVHWGSLAFPDQYSTLTTGLTLDRFTPTDGVGNKFDSTVTQTLGLNLITLSWTSHWDTWVPGFSTNLTAGISPTANQPSEFFQNEVVHHYRHLPPVPSIQPRQDTDAMVDGSVTQWLDLVRPKDFFLGGGFSLGTLYQELFLRMGLRRFQVSPSLYDGTWGSVSVRGSIMARYSRLFDGAVLHAVKPSSTIFQPALAIGQYPGGGKVPKWEVEVAVSWDSGIFVNSVGQSRKEFFWSLAITGGPVRFETWNDSLDDISKTDFGPTYGASLTIDIFRLME
jgi:hypothetical protein